MKNIIAYTLCALTISSFSVTMAQAAPASQTVFINDNDSLFKFLNYGSHTPIVDKPTFLKSIPDLNGILAEISQADEELAGDLLNVLLKNDYFLSNAPLALLPADQTALIGPKAQLQLAITISGHTVLSPEFEGLGSQQAYLLIHEALHSLVSDYENPMHDHQVKNITNYLKQNRGSYKSTTLRPYVQKNVYRQLKEYSYGAFIFDSNLAVELRCDSLREELPKTYELAESYFGLKCDFANMKKSTYFKQYLTNKYKALGISYSAYKVYIPYKTKAYRDTLDLRNLKGFYEPNRVPDAVDMANDRSYYRKYCSDHRGTLSAREEDVVREKQYLDMHNAAAAFFASAKVSEQEKKLVAYYFTKSTPQYTEAAMNAISQARQDAQELADLATKFRNEAIQLDKTCERNYGKYF